MNSLSERISLDDLQKNFGKDSYQSAQKLFQAGAVLDLHMQNKDCVITGKIADKHEEIQARVKFDKENLLIYCSCEIIEKGVPCPHVIALLIAWIENREYLLNEQENRAFIEMLSDEDNRQKIQSSPAALTMEEMIADYRQRLDYFTVNQLRELALRRRIKVGGQHREKILSGLAAGLAEPENLQDAIHSLSPIARKVLDLLLILSENVEQVLYKTLFQWVEVVFGQPDGHNLIEGAFDDLFLAGLAFNLDARVRLPKAVAAFGECNLDLVKTYTDTLDKVDEPQETEISRLVLWLMLLSQLNALECTSNNGSVDQWGWPVSTSRESRSMQRENREHVLPPLPSYLKTEVLKRLAYLTGGASNKLDYAARLMEKAEFWEEASPAALTQNVSQWLQKELLAQNRELFAKGLALESPVELEMACEKAKFVVKYDTYMQFQYKTFLQSLVRARRLFFRILTLLPVGQWVEFESVLKIMHGILPDFIRENSNPHMLWLEINGVTIKTADFSQWRRSYGQFYQAILTGPALWLGICKLGWKAGEPVAFQITPFGAALLDQRKLYTSAAIKGEPQAISFQKEGEIAVNPIKVTPEVLNLLFLIGKFTAPTAPGNERTGAQLFQRLVFRLHNMGIGQAFKAGWSPEKIFNVLQDASGEPLPNSFVSRLQLCWEHFSRLHIYSDMALIQLGDEFCLPELIASTHLSQYLLYKFSPTLVAVRPEGVQEILNELRAKGYTPRTMEHSLV